MSTTALTPNYALALPPAYLLVAMLPHMYSVTIVTRANNGKWDFTAPNSSHNAEIIQKSVPKHVQRQYGRCRSAHNNMFDNAAFVFAGVLAGIITRLDAAWMNWACALYMATRVAYVVSYIGIDTHKWWWMRTVWYMAGNAPIVAMYWQAGKVLVKNGGLP